MKRVKPYIIFLGLSLILSLAATLLAGYDQYRELSAISLSKDIIDIWDEMPVQVPEDSDGNVVKVKDNKNYYGVLNIPKLNITLPVQETWSDYSASLTPCRYTGSLSGDNLIIAGHNFSSHFGKLHSLSQGDTVEFTDALGVKEVFVVSSKEKLNGYDVEGMKDGDWDLTLFTCDYTGLNRITIRCNILERR